MSDHKKKICVVTGTRAEYGLLRSLMGALRDDPDTHLQVIATGMHLSPEFGLTWRDIAADGFELDERVELLLSSDTPVGIAQSVGLGVIGFAGAFDRLKPDCVVILGDRYEMLAAAQSAYIMGVPIAHIGGGETTEGAFDEGIRHCITKLATVHLPSIKPYADRIVQMGENPKTVFCVGSTGVDSITHTPLLDRHDLERALDFSLRKINFLITYHPATLGEDAPNTFENLLLALDEFPDAGLLFTYPNSDTHGRVLIEMIQSYVARNADRARGYINLGSLRYLSAMAQVNCVIGNSSSGLIETPSFGVPTVNIGDRQKGRVCAESVLHCEGSLQAISNAIRKALSPEFREFAKTVRNPYGDGNTTQKIYEILKKYNFSEKQKSFYDLSIETRP